MPPPVQSTATAARPARAGGKRRAALPDVDERLVMPETRYEIIDGKVTYVPPADEAHGTRHSKISAILEAYAADGYDVASDMLTRTSAKGDMAPDASVFPAARHPLTGGRQLDELVFEVVSTERLSHAAKKAQALAARGVRRVFAIDVERRRALSWSRATSTWEILPVDGKIEDPALALALPLRALCDAAKADDAVAQALLGKKNPVIEDAFREGKEASKREGKEEGKREGKEEGKREGKEEGKREGKEEGKREGKKLGVLAGKIAALLAVLETRGIRVSKKIEKRIRTEDDMATVDAWIRRAGVCASIEALLGE